MKRSIKTILLLSSLLLLGQTPACAGYDSPYQGTVQSVSVGNLSPLFTCTITGNPKVNPTLTWALSTVSANQAFGNFTNSSGLPSYGTTSIGAGGTGATSALGGFNNLSPLTSVGDILSFYNGNNVRIAGNTTSTKMFLTSTGTGVAANIPTFGTIQSADIPWGSPGAIGNGTPSTGTFTTLNLTNPLGTAYGGTGNGSLAVTAGAGLYTDGSKVTSMGAGSAYQVYQSNGSSAPSWTNTWNGIGSIITSNVNLTGPCATLQEISNVSGAVTVGVPVASTCPGQLINFVHSAGTNGSNSITVQAQGSDTLSGQTSLALDPANINSSLLIESDGSTWKVLSYLPTMTTGTLYYIGSTGLPTVVAGGSNGKVLQLVSNVPSWQSVAGTGTVTSFAAGTLSPIFTTSVATSTSTPSLSFSLSNAAAHSFLGNNQGTTGAPSYVQPAFTDLSGSASDAQLPATLTGHTLAGSTVISGTTTPSTAGAIDLGSSTKPFRSLYVTDSGDSTYYGKTSVQALSGNVTYNYPAANSTMVQGATAPAGSFATAIDPNTGAITWGAPSFSSITGTVPTTNGGTGATSAGSGFNNLAPANVVGGLIVATGTNQYGGLALGANNSLLGVTGSGSLAYVYGLSGFASQTTTTTLSASSASYQTMSPGSSNVSFNLPAASASANKIFVLEQIAGTGTVSVVPNGTDTVEGLSSTSLISGTPYALISDGSGVWRNLFPNSAQSQINRLIAAAKAGAMTSNYFGTGADGAWSGNGSITSSTGLVVKNFTSMHLTSGVTAPATAGVQALLIYCQGNCTVDSGAQLTMGYNALNATAPGGTGLTGSAGTALSISKYTAGSFASGQTFSSENSNQQTGASSLTTFSITATGGTAGTAGTAGAAAGAGGNGGTGSTVTNGTGGGGGGGGGGGASATNTGLVGGAGSAGTSYCGGAGGGGGRGGASATSSGGSASSAAGTYGATGGAGGNGANSSAGGGSGGGGGGNGGTSSASGGTGGTSTGTGLGLINASGGGGGVPGLPGTLILVVGGTLTNNGSIDSNGAPYAGSGGNGGVGGSSGSATGGAGGGGGGSGGGRVIVLYGTGLSNNGSITATGGAGGSGGFGSNLSSPASGNGGSGGAGGNGSVTIQQIIPPVY